MKRVAHRWERLCCVDIATEAIYRGTENKRTDHEVVRRFGYYDKRPEHYGKLNPSKVAEGARRLVGIYETGWVPSPLRAKHVALPGQKERDLGVPSLTDHLLGWMLILTIQDVIERGMYAFLTIEEADKARALLGKTVIFKTPRGERIIGVLESMPYERDRWSTDFTFTIRAIDYQPEVTYDV